MLESLSYSFRNPKNIIWVIYRIKQLRNYKKTMGSSEDPSLINNVEELGLVYKGLIVRLCFGWYPMLFWERGNIRRAGSIRDIRNKCRTSLQACHWLHFKFRALGFTALKYYSISTNTTEQSAGDLWLCDDKPGWYTELHDRLRELSFRTLSYPFHTHSQRSRPS